MFCINFNFFCECPPYYCSTNLGETQDESFEAGSRTNGNCLCSDFTRYANYEHDISHYANQVLLWVAGSSEMSEIITLVEPRDSLNILQDHGGWHNPEDLLPMPQCIFQQDQSAWLNSMTKCTSKICINHFGRICTRHQWLTQLTCLSIEISPAMVRSYLPQCNRSILAKAQLAIWIRTVTGRNWLAEVGDANELQYLSPASLAHGFAALDVIHKAPTCLTDSTSASSDEVFGHTMASCSFTDVSRHTGNEARPWEYNEPRRSMTVLDSATASYDLTDYIIPYGNYFDRQCFCNGFTVDQNKESCSNEDGLALTRQRLWMNATCGPKSLPLHWTDGIKTTEYGFIPIEDWNWPICFADMPDEVTKSNVQCATYACEVDNHGYCHVKRAVDRSCFCHVISYDACGGSCHDFESRIDYVQWLHSLCGDVRGWHGLPKDWQLLAAPTTVDLIPFPCGISPIQGHNGSSVTFTLKLASMVLLNATPFVPILLSAKIRERCSPRGAQYIESQFLIRVSIVALNTIATVLNAFIARGTPAFEDVPLQQLLLLWCSMPRLNWLASLLTVTKGPEVDTSAISATLAIEWAFQMLASYTMLRAVDYGIEHNFYTGTIQRLSASISAQLMYTGALLWIGIAFVVLVVFVREIYRPIQNPKVVKIDSFPSRKNNTRDGQIFRDPIRVLNKHWSEFELQIYYFLTQASNTSEETTPINNHLASGYGTIYPTLPTPNPIKLSLQNTQVRLYSVSIVSLLLLWVAQWLFWGGFLGLTSDH